MILFLFTLHHLYNMMINIFYNNKNNLIRNLKCQTNNQEGIKTMAFN